MNINSDEVYAILELSYDKKILLPIDKAIDIFKLLHQGQLIEADYSCNIKKIEDIGDKFTLKALTGKRLKEQILALSIEPNKD